MFQEKGRGTTISQIRRKKGRRVELGKCQFALVLELPALSLCYLLIFSAIPGSCLILITIIIICIVTTILALISIGYRTMSLHKERRMLLMNLPPSDNHNDVYVLCQFEMLIGSIPLCVCVCLCVSLLGIGLSPVPVSTMPLHVNRRESWPGRTHKWQANPT